ncbi:MAG: hypothetical protein ACK5AZ_02680 [Bryobacteraceae bacterium]
MKILRPVLRFYSYLYHLALALFLLGIALVALLTSADNLRMEMLPWSGPALIHWLLGLSLAGIVTIGLALGGRLRILFVGWCLLVLYFMVNGFFLGPFVFDGADQAVSAAWLTGGALLAVLGSLMQFGGRPAKKKYY